MAEDANAFRGWIISYRASWPTETSSDPECLLVFGLPPEGGNPTWGLAELAGKAEPVEHTWEQPPRRPSLETITEWIGQFTSPAAAAELAKEFAANRVYLVEAAETSRPPSAD